MRRIALGLVVGCAAFTAAASPARAQGTMRMRFSDAGPTADLTPSQRVFATAYLRAVTGSDVRQYTRLVHPASLACRREDNEEFFVDVFARHQGLSAREPQVLVESLPPRLQLFDFIAKQGFDYPVRPTHLFHVDVISTGEKQLRLGAFSVLLDGSWYEVLPCPTTEAVTRYRAKKAQAAADDAKARELARLMQDQLRAEIMALLKEGKTVAAIKKYREATGADLAMAKRVVEVLESRPR
jgi:hypothetical protein